MPVPDRTRMLRCHSPCAPVARSLVAAGLALAAILGTACSPTFNWRDAPVGDAGLIALLPCKPDRARRDLPLGGAGTAPVAVDMAGCEAGGATFAVAHAAARDASEAAEWLDAWQRAARAQWPAGRMTEAAAQVARAATVPAALRIDTPPPAAGAPTDESRHVLWFAQARGGKVSLYQATVLGQPEAEDVVATFFDGLRLP